MTRGRLLAFRTGDIALDSIMRWAARERPDLLLRWAQPVDVSPPRDGPEGPQMDPVVPLEGTAQFPPPRDGAPGAQPRNILPFTPKWQRNYGRWMARTKADHQEHLEAARRAEPPTRTE